MGFFRRLSRRGLAMRGAAIAVRSLRSGLPRRHPRCRLRRLPSDSLGLIDAPRIASPRRDRLGWLNLHRRWGGRCAWRSGHGRWGGGVSCGARPRPAARAASWGLRGVLRRAMALRAGGGGDLLVTRTASESRVIWWGAAFGLMAKRTGRPAIVISTRVPDGWRASRSACASGYSPRATHHRPFPQSRGPIANQSPHPRKRTHSKFKKSRMSFSAARAAENDGQHKHRPCARLQQRPSPRFK